MIASCRYISLFRMKYCFQSLILLLIPTTALPADQQAVMIRLSPVYSDASSGSAVVSQIGAGTRVSVFERKGGWKQIFSEEKEIIGWVRSYQLRENLETAIVDETAQTDSRGFLSGLASFSRKASGFFKSDQSATSSGTATIGIRGLSEEQIKSAQADFAELEKLKGYTSNPKRVQLFAGQGGLKAQKIDFIPGPGE